MTTILQTRALSKHYTTEGGAIFHALNGIDSTVNAGEFVAIMGPSGSGKSTLLYLMGGLDTPSSGEVLLNGKPLAGRSATELALIRRREIGFVFQFFNLMPTLTVEENVALPLLLDGQNPTATPHRQHIEELIALVGLTEHRLKHPAQLSGGQQQRVALARALVNKPAILLADEPTGNLDSRTADDMLRLLRRLADHQRQTIVMVTHDAHAASIADRLIMLRDGRIVEQAALDTRRSTGEILVKLNTLSE